MKKLFLALLLLFMIQCSCFAESIVSYLIIDGNDEREIEVVVHKERMYLPCKYILDYFEIPYKENHAEKSLSFGKSIIKNNTLFINGEKQSNLVFFEKSGVTGLKNEYFLPAEALTKITEKKITSNPQELIAFIKTKEILEEKNLSMKTRS